MKRKLSRWMVVLSAGVLALTGAGLAHAEPAQPPLGRADRRGALIEGEVTAIQGDALTVETRHRGEIAVQTGEYTRFRARDVAGFSLAGIEVGDTIVARGRFTGERTLQAWLVALVPAELADRAHGKVVAVDGSTITVEDKDGNTVNVVISANTRFHLRGNPDASIDDIEVSMALGAAGQFDADGNLVALHVRAGEPRTRRLLKGGPIAAGKVSEIVDGEIVLSYPGGSTLAVATDASTIVITRGEDEPVLGSLNDVEEGERIVAMGAPSDDGAGLTARVILIRNRVGPVQP